MAEMLFSLDVFPKNDMQSDIIFSVWEIVSSRGSWLSSNPHLRGQQGEISFRKLTNMETNMKTNTKHIKQISNISKQR